MYLNYWPVNTSRPALPWWSCREVRTKTCSSFFSDPCLLLICDQRSTDLYVDPQCSRLLDVTQCSRLYPRVKPRQGFVSGGIRFERHPPFACSRLDEGIEFIFLSDLTRVWRFWSNFRSRFWRLREYWLLRGFWRVYWHRLRRVSWWSRLPVVFWFWCRSLVDLNLGYEVTTIRGERVYI